MREGDPAHVIAHEIVHDYAEDALGFLTYYRLPVWKREGYAEYGSTIAVIREDGAAGLADRIDFLLEDRNWYPGDFAREYYRGAVLVEYLLDVEGYRFADIMDESVTLETARDAMLRWRSAR